MHTSQKAEMSHPVWREGGREWAGTPARREHPVIYRLVDAILLAFDKVGRALLCMYVCINRMYYSFVRLPFGARPNERGKKLPFLFLSSFLPS